MLEANYRHSDNISRDVELAGLEKEQILGDQAGVAMATQVRLGGIATWDGGRGCLTTPSCGIPVTAIKISINTGCVRHPASCWRQITATVITSAGMWS